MRNSPRFLPPAMLACGLLLSLPLPAFTADEITVSCRLHARAVAPGEPLRIEVLAPEPLESLEGEFLGIPVFMVRASSPDDGTRWTGWSMVGLDQEAGTFTLELRGTAAAGRPVVATHPVMIEPKEFPEEHLTVASEYVKPPKEVEERLARERKKLKELYRSRRPDVIESGPFVRPVPGDPTSTFGKRRYFNGEPRAPHPGLDLRAATGTPVRCTGPGVVVLAEELYYSGNTVLVDHGGGLFTIYAHLSEIRTEEGQTIEGGRVIGLSGATGRVTGPHLHWGAKIGNRPFDPQALLDPALFDDRP